jgi:hypothetical protein
LNAEASIAKPDQIIIGQKLYEKLNEKHKQAFRQISGTSSVEDYMNEVSKGKYLLRLRTDRNNFWRYDASLLMDLKLSSQMPNNCAC